MDEIDFKVWALDIESNTFEREDIRWYIRTYCDGMDLSYDPISECVTVFNPHYGRSREIPYISPERVLDWMVGYYEEDTKPEDPKISIEPRSLLDFLKEEIEQLRDVIEAEDEEDMLAHYRKILAEYENLHLKAKLMIEHYEDERQEQETAGPSFQF